MTGRRILLMAALSTSLMASAQTTTVSLGYCNDVVSGCFEKTEAKGAIYIPQELAQLYKGAKVDGVKFGLASSMKNVKIFLTKDLNGEPIVEKTISKAFNGFNIGKFDNAYEITGEAFYIGYSYSGGDNALGYSNLYNENGCWADLGDGWKNYATDADYHSKALAIQARITGAGLPKDLALVSVNSVTAKKGEPFNLSGTVMSNSPSITSNFDIAYSIDGGAEKTVRIEKTIKANSSTTFSIEMPGLAESGSHSVDCRLVNVNGVADPYDGNNKASAFVGVASRMPKYRMVCEEGTGTWCQACPLGIVGLEYMYEKYPDNFIGIAVHPYEGGREAADLVPQGYTSLQFTSYPSGYVNRSSDMYVSPSSTTLEAAYEATKDNFRLGEIEVNSEFTDGEKKSVNATATMTFMSDIYAANYKVAFVMTENNVGGYSQSNAYAGGSTKMGGFENMGSVCSIELEHVARAIWGYRGLDNSVPTTIREGQPVTFTQTLSIPSNVKNVDNLQVIALLFNGETGLIENGAEAKVGNSSGTTAIADVANAPEPQVDVRNGRIVVEGYDGTFDVYTIDGKLVKNVALPHGVYVVKGNSADFVKRVML